MKRYLMLSLVFAFAVVSLSFGQGEPKTIKGTIKTIAQDSTYIVIDATKIITTKDFVDENYLEVDDEIIVTVQDTPSGPQAVDVEYVIEERDWDIPEGEDWPPEFEAPPTQ